MPVARKTAQLLLMIFPFVWALFSAMLSGAASDLATLIQRVIVVALLVALVFITRWFASHKLSIRWFAFMSLATLLLYLFAPRTVAAAFAFGGWLCLLAYLELSLRHRVTGRLARWGMRCVIGLIFGCVPVVLAQVQGGFADEEFFALVQTIALSVFGIGLLAALPLGSQVAKELRVATSPWRVLLGVALILVLVFFGSVGVVRAYQNSFYASDPPGFAGITPQQPSLCTSVPPESGQPSGVEVFARILRAVNANPNKTPAEFGMLAIGAHDRAAAERFRAGLLSEAQSAQFTQPMGSVKWGQFEAALRAYYFAKVTQQFPDLFSQAEVQSIRNWFAAINRRALTAEWVDYAYAIAFSKPADGPYENQENGAGLLAVLEATGLGDPALSARNRAYLDAVPRGWAARFHNTDDSYFYQTQWINNAFFLSLYAPGAVNTANRSQSFEWLLQQAMPDGTVLAYNNPDPVWPIGADYLGATILGDPRYVWLASQSLDKLEAAHRFLAAQPGVDTAIALQGTAPDTGSCLQYSDSGLPNQVGPLAPDKVILRDGWGNSASYVLLNLRFTGWHRYKATNAIISVFMGEPKVVEQTTQTQISWLPAGRAALRDKRLQRENLNGLLIPANGIAGVFAMLGFGDQWAQDPPQYAQVTQLSLNTNPQIVQTTMKWDGWSSTRALYYYPHGPIIAIDTASGGEGRAALAWTAAGTGAITPEGTWLQSGAHPFRFAMLDELDAPVSLQLQPNAAGQSIVYSAAESGRLRTITIFLSGTWLNAHVSLSQQSQALQIRSETETIQLNLPLE